MDIKVWSRDLTFLLTSLLGCCIQYVDTASACDELRVSNTRYQSSREGKYDKFDTCNGRVSYKQKDGGPGYRNYIFYLDDENGWHGWMIGTSHCYNRGGIAVQEDAETPDKADDPWDEVSGGFWVTSYDLEVKCVEEVSVASIVGIVFGILIILGLLVIFIVCCCKKNNKKRGTVRDSRLTVGRPPHTRGQGRAANRHRSHNLHQQTTTTSSTSTSMYYSAQQPQTYGNNAVFYSAQSGVMTPLTHTGAPMSYTMQGPPAYSTVLGPPPAYDSLSQHNLTVTGQGEPPTYLTPLESVPTAPSTEANVDQNVPSQHTLYSTQPEVQPSLPSTNTGNSPGNPAP